ncbi:D-aminoacyl-tRNA deacylase [Carboxylicivirga sp. N1Y90]|uniref:D-aminoacyl-tRNA deacylase n=1 Tax=Carboxylicivirga fragile TaxID=3417571 RepID=UPI003D340318|nr:D-tyrosyl-tRNA(Tyr) deacylase [Marinilabiliaceae bacterium N1Y90]
MRVVIQRVKQASVSINGILKSSISNGLMIFVGIENEDGPDDINWLANKIYGLRIFDDVQGVMNCSIRDVEGEILLISQFTLHAKTKKGNRPSYIKAARPEHAIPIYEQFIAKLDELNGKPCGTGEFGANMQVSLINDGPVTIIIDSKQKD